MSARRGLNTRKKGRCGRGLARRKTSPREDGVAYAWRGQTMAFVLALAALVAAVMIVINGYELVGAFVGTGGVFWLARAFVVARLP
jgi:uncharacterized membrane protein